MKEFVRMFFASLLAIIFFIAFGIFVVAGIASVATTKKPDIKRGSYLVVDIYGPILAYNPPDDIIAEIFGEHPETVQRILGNLEKAAADKRIEGVIVKVSAFNTLGNASIEEIRGAIHRVRDAGKTVYAFSDFLDRKSLFLAAACDSIFMPRAAEVIFLGGGLTTSHLLGTLEKLGIKPHIHKIDEYKSAAEMFIRKDMSPEAREMYTWILNDVWEVQMKALADERRIPEQRLVELMDYALFVAEEAQEAGLIDGLLYWDQLEARLKQEDDKKLRTVSQDKYANVKRGDVGLDGKKKIAVVHAQGLIGGRHSQVDPMLGIIMGHETIGKELRRVRRDEKVAAVVFRVDSRGGEALASDLIGREVKALAAEKPVVSSMIDVAASGGYHISYVADKVVADPLTITGSIGSIAGKFNVAGFYNKLGVTFDHVSKGPNALMWSPYQDFTDKQRKRFEENHWQSFNLWLEDVAEVRGIPLEEMKKLAAGRVWTGRQAQGNGLVDEVGGLDRAIEVAKELAGIPAEEKVTLVHYPEKKTLIEMITGGRMSTAIVRWVLYQFIRKDLSETVHLLTSGAVPIEGTVSK